MKRVLLVLTLVLALGAPAAVAQAAPWVPGPEYVADGAYCPRPPRRSNAGFAVVGVVVLAGVLLRRVRPAD
jgi:hypothetical protein